MVAQGTVQAEELYMPKAFADVAEEMETKIHILFRRGQGRANDKDPAFDRRGDKEPFHSRDGKAIFPGAAAGIGEAEGFLYGSDVAAANGEPLLRQIEAAGNQLLQRRPAHGFLALDGEDLFAGHQVKPTRNQQDAQK